MPAVHSRTRPWTPLVIWGGYPGDGKANIPDTVAANRLVTTSAKPKIDSKKLAAAMARSTAELWKPSGGLVGYQ